MKDYETVEEYDDKIKQLTNQMRAFGGDITNKRVV